MVGRLLRALVGVLLVPAFAPPLPAANGKAYVEQRARLLETVRAYAARPGSGAPGGRISERVLDALKAVPRHELVPEPLRTHAYSDRPLPIGFGQTISQPYVVALMTELLDVGPEAKVLEVGTGSGYQAAVLSRLVRHVYTVEIVEALARRAAADLARLGYDNVTVRAGDGFDGWFGHAPYDGIIVTAAPREIPPPLIDQLAAGGRLVMPLEEGPARQSLIVVEKGPDGRIARRDVIPVRFVPLTRGGR